MAAEKLENNFPKETDMRHSTDQLLPQVAAEHLGTLKKFFSPNVVT
jgi:hypothetical protein